MRKIILFLMSSTFFMTIPVISIEREFALSAENHYHLTRPAYTQYYDTIPSNPNVYETIKTFEDANLTQSKGKITPNQDFSILRLTVNDFFQPVFELADGTFVLADPKRVFDDVVIASSNTNSHQWLTKDAQVLSSPIGKEAQKVSKAPGAYTKVLVTEEVRTPRGSFAKIDQGWVSVEHLSTEDNRMEKVQDTLNRKYNQGDYAIYVKQLDTGLTAGINQDKTMYAASTAKLPVLYYAQLQLELGSITLDDKLKYTDAVHKFKGAYLPDGAGSMVKKADNKDYRVEELISLTAKTSDNVASNLLAYYLTDQFNGIYYGTMDGITGKRLDMEQKNATPEMVGLTMEALYRLNPDGVTLEELSQTAFDNQRISQNIDVRVAHKIGDAYDYRHDVALVYAESPFILSIYTNHKTYKDITNIADDVYALLK